MNGHRQVPSQGFTATQQDGHALPDSLPLSPHLKVPWFLAEPQRPQGPMTCARILAVVDSNVLLCHQSSAHVRGSQRTSECLYRKGERFPHCAHQTVTQLGKFHSFIFYLSAKRLIACCLSFPGPGWTAEAGGTAPAFTQLTVQ